MHFGWLCVCVCVCVCLCTCICVCIHMRIASHGCWLCLLIISRVILIYQLIFVQLTWQIDNGWFSPVFDDLFQGMHQYWANMYMGLGRKDTGVGHMMAINSWKKSQVTQMAEFRVAMMSTCTHSGSILYKA